MGKRAAAGNAAKKVKNDTPTIDTKGKEDKKNAAVKKRGRPKKVPTPEPEPETVEEDELEDEVEIVEDIDWKDDDGFQLTWTMISAIEDDPLIRASLFPPVGGGPKLTGGKPKSDYQFQLAKLLFADHPKYKDAFAKAVKAKEKKTWYLKIKNRQEFLTKRARLYIEEMGQTGAGLDSEKDIEPGSALMTKWDVIVKDFPWFFRVRALIGERPHLVPTGLGNNDSEIDMSLLLGADHDGDSSSLAADDTFDPALLADEDSDSDIPHAPTLASVKSKRKRTASIDADDTKPVAAVDKPAKKKTKPTAGVSQPAPVATPTAKHATAKDKFAAAVAAEEATAQESLKLKRAKHADRKEVRMEELRVKGELKAEKGRQRLELAKMKMQHDHEFRLEQMRAANMGLGQSQEETGAVLVLLFWYILQSQAGPSSHGGAYTGGSHGGFDLPILPTPSDSGASGASYDYQSMMTGDFGMPMDYTYGTGKED
ncbi:hypothetical protein DFH06DRAFT_1325590 [Mycena polygramma]|nr:hypothetical protein DFH06DRAFT_1325590 [Mycena polygramma]